MSGNSHTSMALAGPHPGRPWQQRSRRPHERPSAGPPRVPVAAAGPLATRTNRAERTVASGPPPTTAEGTRAPSGPHWAAVGFQGGPMSQHRQPTLGARASQLLDIDGLQFKDLNGNGRLD